MGFKISTAHNTLHPYTLNLDKEHLPHKGKDLLHEQTRKVSKAFTSCLVSPNSPNPKDIHFPIVEIKENPKIFEWSGWKHLTS